MTINVFADALNDIFSDLNLGTDALWRAGAADPGIPVRVIIRQPDRVAEFGETRIAAATNVLELRVADAPTLDEGDTFEIGGTVYVVQGQPVRDAARLIWTAEVRPA